MLDLSLMSDGQLPNLDEFSVLRPSKNLDMCPNTHVTNNTTTQLRSHLITFDIEWIHNHVFCRVSRAVLSYKNTLSVFWLHGRMHVGWWWWWWFSKSVLESNWLIWGFVCCCWWLTVTLLLLLPFVTIECYWVCYHVTQLPFLLLFFV